MISPEQPSLSFMKNKYQFHVLEFMHERNGGERVEEGVRQFIAYFGLQFAERREESFAVRLQELEQSERKFVRECL